MKQRTAEEWEGWVTDFVETANLDELLRDELYNHITEEVFMHVFVESLARSLVKKAIEDGDIERQGAYEMVALVHFTRIAVMGALLIGYALGQEVQKGT